MSEEKLDVVTQPNIDDCTDEEFEFERAPEESIGITDNFDVWMESLNGYPIDPHFDLIRSLPEFKTKNKFMVAPTAIYKHNMVVAVTKKFETLDDLKLELQRDDFILYMVMFNQDNFRLRGAYV